MKHAVTIALLTLAAIFFMIGMSYGYSRIQNQCRENNMFQGLVDRNYGNVTVWHCGRLE